MKATEAVALLTETLTETTEALEQHLAHEAELLAVVNGWIAAADNPAYPDSTRETYRTCAEEVAEIMTR